MKSLVFFCLIFLKIQAKGEIVDVFTIGEGGYFCLKIPYLLSTFNSTLIAWSEARLGSCADWTGTDLVMKRSNDQG